jgi:hypothetical protein
MIDFPVLNNDETTRLGVIINQLSDHFHSPITIENVTMMRVKYEGSCNEMDIILKQLAGDPAGIKVKRIYKNNEEKLINLPRSKPFLPSQENLEKGINPNGS